MKRLSAVIISALICTCFFTGCSGSNSKEQSSTAASTDISVKSDAETSADETGGSTSESTADNSSAQGSSTETPSADDNPKEEPSSEDITNKNYRELDADYTIENGIIVVNQDGHYRAMELFGEGSGDAYVDSLNTLRSKLDSNIRIYSMIAPLASEFYLPANYSEYSSDQKAYIDDITSRLDSGITTVDVVTPLSRHTAEPIYCRTDHHWMPLGAYYASQALANSAGVEFNDLSTYEPVTIENFVGTMYAFTEGDIRIKNDPEDFTYYKSSNYPNVKTDFYDTSFNYDYTGSYYKEVGDPQSNAYLTFFGGDEQIVKIRSDVKNGRKLLIVKDSYGNAVPGYLMQSFEEIYIIDMRYFNLNLVDFIQQLGITDVSFTMCIYSAFGENAYNLPDMISNNEGQTIVDNYDSEN